VASGSTAPRARGPRCARSWPDFRPKLSAIRAFAGAFGEDALDDLPSHPVTASWREQHVLAPAQARLDGPIVDLNEPEIRNELDRRHATLLAEHGLDHPSWIYQGSRSS